MNKKSLILASLIFLNSVSYTRPAHARDDRIFRNQEFDQMAQASFQIAVENGVCLPNEKLNVEVVPYTDGYNHVNYGEPQEDGTIVGTKKMYMQTYTQMDFFGLVSAYDHEMNHFCAISEIFDEPISLNDEYELVSTVGFGLIIRNKETGEILTITELEEARATIYMENVSQDPDFVREMLFETRQEGYLNNADFIREISKTANVSPVILSFSNWLRTVTGEPLSAENISKIIYLSQAVYHGKMTPQEAVQEFAN